MYFFYAVIGFTSQHSQLYYVNTDKWTMEAIGYIYHNYNHRVTVTSVHHTNFHI